MIKKRSLGVLFAFGLIIILGLQQNCFADTGFSYPTGNYHCTFSAPASMTTLTFCDVDVAHSELVHYLAGTGTDVGISHDGFVWFVSWPLHNTFFVSTATAPAPIPASGILLGSSLLGLIGIGIRRKRLG